MARRGTSKRGRGGKGVSASPKTRAKPVEETTEEKLIVAAKEAEKPTEEKDESMDASDGNFMDGFQLVDEVQEDW